MAAGPWTPVNSTRTNLLNGTFDLDSDSFKVALVTSSGNISASTTAWSGVTGEVTSGNGYTTGGESVTLSLTGTTSVAVTFASNPVWTASGSGIAAKWAVIYEVGGNVLAYALLNSDGSTSTTTDGNTLTVNSSGANYIFTLA
ncbi:hypothetical protein SEA_FLYPOTENUSE_27 [Mycobacterium phage Flypotenuse]|nr:hypothetical protein SEA_YOUNGBLOOD_29 [Mycobacterium phage Youngblood]AXH49848.1 hypothetical protein SEA_GLEXAN_27 [Mycobacterium phage Glexan]AYR00145.1 hypothetical protein PBI_PAT3_28 [Mycobacterium phage Pat3]QDH91905.1 hypothetical protein SEA_FLYPOTENUSE_27 [Mycobacterium phage Flypotenuse]QPL14761.1 hypothetical protein SEA_HARELLA_28 [Mycobacterium phage Harella]